MPNVTVITLKNQSGCMHCQNSSDFLSKSDSNGSCNTGITVGEVSATF